MNRVATGPAAPPPVGAAGIVDAARFDALLRELLSKYLALVGQSRTLPVVSITGLLRFVCLSLRWLFSIYGLIVAAALDITIRPLWNLFGHKTLAPWSRWPLRWLASPFRTLHRGEVSGLRFFSLRAVIRLFLFYRLSQRLDPLMLYLKERRVYQFLEAPTAVDAGWFDDRVETLRACREVIGSQLGAAVVASAAGSATIFALAPKLWQLAPDDWKAPLLTLVRFGLDRLPIALQSSDALRPPTLPEVALMAAAYLVWILVTGWIDLRALVRAADLQGMESGFFDACGIERVRDVPVDLIGCALLAILAFVPAALQDPTINPAQRCLIISLFVCLPLYALVRRWWFHTDEAGAAPATR